MSLAQSCPSRAHFEKRVPTGLNRKLFSPLLYPFLDLCMLRSSDRLRGRAQTRLTRPHVCRDGRVVLARREEEHARAGEDRTPDRDCLGEGVGEALRSVAAS